MENLPALNLKNLDKSQWKTYRFDEIAKNISERVDPNNTDLEVYVGLEHIDSESIHLKRSGTPDDVDGQKLRFYPGDVIFGRRRAYQRKAAVATTDGFCSAHALVLRANPEVIDPQLFPFFMHSDAFMHRAVDISVGSLSPTINWGSLKHQSFTIPPLDQQPELTNLLWSLDELYEAQLSNLIKLNTLRRSNENKYLKLDACKPEVNATDFFDKIADGTHETPKKEKSGYKLLTSKNIVQSKLDFETDYFISETDYFSINKRSKVDPNDILFGMIGTVGQVCRITEEPNYAIKNMGLFKTKDLKKSFVAFYYFKSDVFQNLLKSQLSGTSQKYVSLGYLRSLKLPDSDNSKVLEWMNKELQFDKLIHKVENLIGELKSMKKTLTNQLL